MFSNSVGMVFAFNLWSVIIACVFSLFVLFCFRGWLVCLFVLWFGVYLMYLVAIDVCWIGF